MQHERVKSFEKISELYESNRPSYPKQLIDEIIHKTSLQVDAHILDIGCGTGKSTRLFAELGFHVTGIDRSEKMIEVARNYLSKFKNVELFSSSFEEAQFPTARFDLITCAQSFHFLDKNIACQKISDWLKPRGYLAVFANYPNEKNAIIDDLIIFYKQYCEMYPRDYGSTQKLENIINQSLLFEPISKSEYDHSISYDKNSYLNLIQTFSFVNVLEKYEKEILLNKIVERLEKEAAPFQIPYTARLLMARKR